MASLLVTLLGILSSLFNNIIYDEILPYQQKDVLKIMLAVFLGISLTSTFVSFVRQWILMHLSIKIDIPLMLGYFEHIYKLPMKFFASRKTGDITTRFSDAFTIEGYFYKYSIIAYHGYINGSYHRCDTVSGEPKAFCGNCNDDNHKYSAGIYI